MSYKLELLDRTTLNKIKDIEVVNEPEVYEEINGSFTFDFDAHYTSKNDLTSDRLIKVDDKYFTIAKVTKSRNDTITLSVHCEHISYELIVDYEVSEDMEFESDAQTMISNFLQGTRFTLVSCIPTIPMYYRTKTLDIRKRLFEVANLFGGELIFDNFNVSLVSQRGADRGLDVELGVNLLGVTEEKDFVEGKTAYELDLLDLSHVSSREINFSSAQLGDTITIRDGVLGIDSNERIIAISYNPFQKALPTVVVGDYIPDFVEYVRDEEEEEEEEEEKDIKTMFKQFKIGGIDMLKSSTDVIDDVKEYYTNKYVTGVEVSGRYNSLKKELVGIVAEKSDNVSGVLSVIVTKIDEDGLITTTVTEINSPTQLNNLSIKDITNVTLVLSQKSLSYYKENPIEIEQANIQAIGICVTFDTNDEIFLEKFNVGKMSVLGVEDGNVTELVKQYFTNRSSIPIAPSNVEIDKGQILKGIQVIPTEEYKKWHLNLIHAYKNEETWQLTLQNLPLANNSSFEVGNYEQESVIAIISNEPLEKIMDGTASEELYYQAFGASFSVGEVKKETDVLAEFRIGNVDMLSIASDETATILNGGAAVSNNIYTITEPLQGLFVSLKPKYANYHVIVIELVDDIFQSDDYNDSMKSNVYGESKASNHSVVIIVSTVPMDEIDGEIPNDVVITALGVCLELVEDENQNTEETYLEYGNAALSDEMYLYFQNGPYDHVHSITTGITDFGGASWGDITITVEKVYSDDGRIEALIAYSNYGHGPVPTANRLSASDSISTMDFQLVPKANFQAVCEKSREVWD